MSKQRIVKDLSNHLLRLSHNNQLLAKQRWGELISRTGGDKRILSKLTKMQSRSYEQLLHLADQLLKLK